MGAHLFKQTLTELQKVKLFLLLTEQLLFAISSRLRRWARHLILFFLQ